MMATLNFPDDLKYNRSDEWVRIEGETATIGISDYAQDALNDLVYIELPEVNGTITKGETFGSVESVKAQSDLYAPVSGTVLEVNTALEDEPELMNTDPYGRGWIVKVQLSNAADADDLMNAADYRTYSESR
jgi:glycine cleavage system H protein